MNLDKGTRESVKIENAVITVIGCFLRHALTDSFVRHKCIRGGERKREYLENDGLRRMCACALTL